MDDSENRVSCIRDLNFLPTSSGTALIQALQRRLDTITHPFFAELAQLIDRIFYMPSSLHVYALDSTHEYLSYDNIITMVTTHFTSLEMKTLFKSTTSYVHSGTTL